MATPAQTRIVGLDIQAKVAAFKAAVDAVDTVAAAWTLDGLDAALPTDTAVKEQLAAFDALSKPAINMTEALSAIRAAV